MLGGSGEKLGMRSETYGNHFRRMRGSEVFPAGYEERDASTVQCCERCDREVAYRKPGWQKFVKV